MIRQLLEFGAWVPRSGLLVALAGGAAAGPLLPFGAHDHRVAHDESALRHPVHVSSTQVDLSRDERSLEVTIRIFTDDLEEALKAAGTPVLVGKSPAAAVDSALSRYLRAHVQFELDARGLVPLRMVGHEREEEATLVFLDVALAAVPSRMAVAQRVLLDRFDDQTNLLHVRFGTKKRSALLRRGNERADFTL